MRLSSQRYPFSLNKMQSSLKMLKYFLVVIMLLAITKSNAQDQYQAISFKIDSLANIGLPKSALKEVDRLDNLAHKNNNAAQQVRAVIYRMTFQSYLEENALAAIISRLKNDAAQADYPVKPVLQSVLGQMYWNYYQQNRYQFAQRSKLEKPDSDFTKWDLRTVIDETSRLYDLSLLDAAKEQKTPVGVLDGVLEGDSTTRYLRPTLYDLLLQRAFDFFLTDEAGLSKPRLPFSLNDPRFFSDSRTFANLEIKTTDTASTEYKGIRYLQQATLFHLQKQDEEALADLDMQRLKFLYGRSNVEHKDSLYLAALKQIAGRFSAKPISSEALVLQGQYYQGLDSLTIAYWFFKKAVAAYPESLGGKNAATLIKQVEAKGLTASTEDVNMPGKPILALLTYKNLSAAGVAVYRLYGHQLNDDFETGYSDMSQTKHKLEVLSKLTPVQRQELKLPGTADFRKHTLEFKIDALPPGNYVLMIKDSAANEYLTDLGNFKVSGLAYTARANPNSNIEVSVMNRETGAPLENVKINLRRRHLTYNNSSNKNEWEYADETGHTNKDGLFYSGKFSQGDDLTVNLILKDDTLKDGPKYFYGARYNFDDDVSRDRTVLFTDRQIYRPGQTIYFKGIQLQTQSGKSILMTGKNIDIDFFDVNGKQVSSLTLKTNEFGTFAGSFIIPQTMLNGSVTLRTHDGEILVKVEEYKRPSFQVEFLPLKESYKLNDTVTVKGNVTAFSGYGLSLAKVAYHVLRSQNRVFMNPNVGRALYGSRYDNPETTEIKTDTIMTDDQGQFEAKFNALPGMPGNTNYSYTITADVTDASGETHSSQTSVTIGNNDIRINSYIPDRLFAKDSLNALVSLQNLNGELQKGDIKIEVYALKNPNRVFKDRLWPQPDQHIISEADFKNDFPFYTYESEDQPSTWKKLDKVIDLNIKADGENLSTINLSALKNQQPGRYRVIIKARNEKGDTVSATQYINLINKTARPLKFEDWLVPVRSTVKPGESAEFLVGLNQKVNVLMERYNGPKLVSSRWIAIDGQQSIKIPITDTDKHPSVQFMMVYQNRIFISYETIKIANLDQGLKIKFLTFRNKLQPGEMEQWKLQLSNQKGEKQAAEMLADLYDASLDDITPPQNWEGALSPDENYQPNYFVWIDNGFVTSVSTLPVIYTHVDYSLLTHEYEQLDMFGYDYYGGYNNSYRNYLGRVEQNLIARDENKYAAAIKNGYDISGRVLGADDKFAIVGASVKIKGTNIRTLTDVSGYFKIRVPKNARLVFSYIGYETTEILTSKGGNITVTLKPAANALNEVVVTGYTAQYKKDITGSNATVNIRGVANAKNTPLADSEQLLQGQAAGVQITNKNLSYSTRIVLRGNRSIQQPDEKPITLRSNFNETAFFYPQLHTNEKGEILIDFTIPEALTKWKFRGFAHTKDSQTGYIENTVVTQKQLSISANTPRFLREGDTITISARLVNLTGDKLNGKVQMKLFNALNMQPVALFVNAGDASQQFEIAGGTNKALSFRLAVPAGLDALTYRLTADAGEFTDGEENTLPVLPNRTLVTESMPMMVRSGQTRSFTFDKLVNQNSSTLKNKTLTLEYTQNPAWYAVQALPYMMEFPYECSEQVFSRYFANSLATSIVNKLPAIKQVFDQWKMSNSTELLSNLEKNQELKSTLIEETPWLNDAVSETEQKKRIALLFDLNKMSNELKLNLEKLQKRQLPDGGFTWFGGDRSDRYITQHIAEGIGELYHLGIADNQPGLKQAADNAIRYLDEQLVRDDKYRKKNNNGAWFYGDLEIHAWFTRSYFLNKSMSHDSKAALETYLKWAADNWKYRNAYEQGMIALTMQRYKKPAITAMIERSLLETAQQSDDMGMYWAKNRQGYYWYDSPIETQSLLIELFTEAGDNAKAVDEMKIWLLRNKQTSDWKTTKATAAACYALLLKGSNLLADTGKSTIKLDGKLLEELKPGVKADAGTGYIKTSWADEQVKPALGKVEITNNSKTISWGALHWQYLDNLDKITSSQTNIHLERKYFIQKQTDAGPVLTAVDATHQPKTGDLLKVVVYLKADRDFEYVQLKDMRPAGTEPVDALSTYKYQDGLYYYQVTKDVATNFFISYLNKGDYVFEYRLRVAQSGNFSTGITSVQCMYVPEFNAHSQGTRMTIKP